MKIISKVLIGLAGLVGGALIERGITGYGDDIAELRRKADPDEIEDGVDTGEDDGEATAEPEDEPEAEPEETE